MEETKVLVYNEGGLCAINDIVYKCDYFEVFEERTLKPPKQKTSIYSIWNNNAIFLGYIKWFPSWRKYCFFPDKETVWDNKCLMNIVDCVADINKNYFAERKRNK